MAGRTDNWFLYQALSECFTFSVTGIYIFDGNNVVFKEKLTVPMLENLSFS